MRKLFYQMEVYKERNEGASTVFTGTGAPSVLIGVKGDYYIDTVLSRLYGPKIGGSWGVGVLI